MSLLSDYHKELGVKHVIESEYGFMVYYFVLPDECFIEDGYVIPEKRRSGLCSNMMDQVSNHAKSVGCKYLTAAAIPKAKNYIASLKMQMKYGFRILRNESNAIYMIKDI